MTEESRPKLQRGSIGKLVAYFINSQLTILLIVALMVLGMGAIVFTPKEENPQISLPAADVYLTYPGAPAKVVEETLIVPVEAEIKELKGVEHIYSVAENSQGKITVQFFVGENWEESLFKLQNQLASHRDYLLPPTASYIIKPISVDDVPIVTLTVTGKNYSDDRLRRVGERLLLELGSIPNTANQNISGGQGRAILVDLDPDKLASYNLNFGAIAARIQAENSQSIVGDIPLETNRLSIRGGQLLQSAADVGNIVVGSALNSPIYLRDIATVRDGFSDRTTFSRITYRRDWDIGEPYPDTNLRPTGEFITQPAITINIAKKPGTNAVRVAKQIFQRVEQLKPQLPPGITIAVTRNDGRTASSAVNDLYRSLILAIIIVMILLIPFLGWRAAGIVAFVIPLTLAGTLGVGWIAGQTINRITLFALILALGTLVDDAIAVTENIQRRLQLESPSTSSAKTQVAISAVSELGTPVILSTITVILAFLPMGFVTGMMGPYMSPIPFNVPVAMIISTILSLTVIPFLALRGIKNFTIQCT